MKIERGPGVNRRETETPWLLCDELTGEELATLWTSPRTKAIVCADPRHVAVRVDDPAILAEYRALFDTRPMRVVSG